MTRGVKAALTTDQVFDYLDDHGEKSLDDLVDHFKFSSAIINDRLRTLLVQDRVQKIRRGYLHRWRAKDETRVTVLPPPVTRRDVIVRPWRRGSFA